MKQQQQLYPHNIKSKASNIKQAENDSTATNVIRKYDFSPGTVPESIDDMPLNYTTGLHSPESESRNIISKMIPSSASEDGILQYNMWKNSMRHLNLCIAESPATKVCRREKVPFGMRALYFHVSCLQMEITFSLIPLLCS
ncbi:hypothetical protein AVEN_202282-1 [Araneus ventricosus]|uniref:Uncharacterized protein n=1 Tax=Araneus ventricosus TaxID=182803 RepID=A0A4Y2GQF6_ARAVE|nr:hypothetical protein AVEN_202282-1 [Araneus ventricosus]